MISARLTGGRKKKSRERTVGETESVVAGRGTSKRNLEKVSLLAGERHFVKGVSKREGWGGSHLTKGNGRNGERNMKT